MNCNNNTCDLVNNTRLRSVIFYITIYSDPIFSPSVWCDPQNTWDLTFSSAMYERLPLWTGCLYSRLSNGFSHVRNYHEEPYPHVFTSWSHHWQQMIPGSPFTVGVISCQLCIWNSLFWCEMKCKTYSRMIVK